MNITKPFNFQLDAVACMNDFGLRCLLASDMGLCKTFDALLCLVENPSALPTIIVCPAGLKHHWAREAAHHVDMQTEILNSTSPPRRYKLKGSTKLVVVNYDILEPWLPFLKSLHPRTIILDEVHYVKERQAKRSRWTRTLCDKVPYLLALSGTPLLNHPAELWNILNLLRPDLFPSFVPFANRYCAPRWTYWGWKYDGAENLDELHALLLKHLMVRQRKQDVLGKLPPLRHMVVPFTLPPQARAEYDHAENDFLNWLRTISPSRARKAERSEGIAKIGYLLRLAARLKLPQVVEWIDNYFTDCDDKLAVYGVGKQLLQSIHTRWEKSSVLINGDTPPRKREQLKDHFNAPRGARLLVGNTTAAGVGLSIKCPTLAVVETGWAPAEVAQVTARVHGVGRGVAGRASHVYYLCAADTLEERKYSVLQRKQQTLDAVLDGRGGGDNWNVYDLLIESLRKDKHP